MIWVKIDVPPINPTKPTLFFKRVITNKTYNKEYNQKNINVLWFLYNLFFNVWGQNKSQQNVLSFWAVGKNP